MKIDRRYFKRNTSKNYIFSSVELDELFKLMKSTKGVLVSTIDAGYTYFGQFIAHEIVPSTRLNPYFKTTPFMNLDSLYGIKTNLNLFDEDGKFIINEAKNSYIDFKRDSKGAYLLLEKRNDENILISQFHCLWLKLHNRLLDLCICTGIININDAKSVKIERIRDLLVFIFQKVIINDYLKTIINKDVYNYFINNKSIMYKSKKFNAIPLEFSHSVFRFGHSMIRNSYNINKINTQNSFGNHKLIDLFIKDKSLKIPNNKIVNWKLFFGKDSTNKAFKIDLHITDAMDNLHKSITKKLYPLTNIVEINLKAGEQAKLLSGYQIHEKIIQMMMKYKLDAGELLKKLDSSIFKNNKLKNINVKNLPLWLYILHESLDIRVRDVGRGSGSVLGKLGSIITMEVIMNSIRASNYNKYIDENKLFIKECLGVDVNKITISNLI